MINFRKKLNSGELQWRDGLPEQHRILWCEAGRVMNPNLIHLHDAYCTGYRGVVLEGSSRSAKTWSSIDFNTWLTSTIETKATINLIKETYNSFKTTLHDDFNRRLPDYGIASPFALRQEVSMFRQFGNKINLLGADNETVHQGVGSDYFWINESLDVSNSVFDQAEMRCRKFWWMDYNPKVADHWVYDKICNRPDVAFLKSTFRDNPHISDPERRKIESYEPTPANIAQGTADDFMWNVYGLGIRSAPEGLIFQHVTWVTEFPTNIEKMWYGLDFGYTNHPSCLVRVGVIKDRLYAKCLFYSPTPSLNELEPVLRQHVGKDTSVWADPSGEYGDRGMISGLRRMGYKVFGTRTFPGSIKYGIGIMKRYKIHLIDCPEVRKEQAGYRFREINGIRLDMPVDDKNHFWDAFRMPVISNLTPTAS